MMLPGIVLRSFCALEPDAEDDTQLCEFEMLYVLLEVASAITFRTWQRTDRSMDYMHDIRPSGRSGRTGSRCGCGASGVQQVEWHMKHGSLIPNYRTFGNLLLWEAQGTLTFVRYEHYLPSMASASQYLACSKHRSYSSSLRSKSVNNVLGLSLRI